MPPPKRWKRWEARYEDESTPAQPRRIRCVARSGWLVAFVAMSAPLDPIRGVIGAGVEPQLVGEGFDGTEGPLPLPDGGLLFTENRAGRVIKLAPDGAKSVFLEQTNGSNSLAFAPNGDLVSVQTKEPASACCIRCKPYARWRKATKARRSDGRTTS